MQEVEHDMMAMLQSKRSEVLERVSGTSSSLVHFQSQGPPDSNLNKISDRISANILSPHLRSLAAQPVRKVEFLSVNTDDSLHQQGVQKLENS